jgi:hypothetical protein
MSSLPLSRRAPTSCSSGSKYCSIVGFERLLTTTMWSIPAPSASSMMIWIAGVSPIGISSFGTALVAGRNRVPRPAAGMTALRTCMPTTLPGATAT